MAGDWIAVRTDLERDPAVFHIAKRLKCSRREVVGHLVAVWSWFDGVSRSGHAPGVTAADLDSLIGCRGLAEAMQTTPESAWLAVRADGSIEMPNYDVWLSQSAKRRLLAAKRKRYQREREIMERVTKMSRSDRDSSGTTGQDRRVTTASAPTGAAPPTPKARKEPTGDHAAAVAHWHSEYQRTRSTPYAFQAGKDGEAVKWALKAGGLALFKTRATALLEHPDPFYAAADLGTLRSAWNKLAVSKPPTPGYMRPAEPEAPGPGVPLEARHAAIRAAIDAANGKQPERG